MTQLIKEVLHYLEYIKKFWTNLLDGTGAPNSAIDADTVSALQSRVPGLCIGDRKWLEEQMQSHTIFISVTDAGVRDRLWQKIREVHTIIPTLATFFEDLKYFALCRKVVAKLLPPASAESVSKSRREKHSVSTSLRQLHLQHAATPAAVVEVERARKEVWLAAMRSWPKIIINKGKATPRPAEGGLGL
jgi:Protein of unknown function (DUF3723)